MEKQQIITELVELSNEARRQAIERNNILFADFGLSDTALRILEYFHWNPDGAEAARIAEHYGLSKNGMTFPIDSLERMGYVQRRQHPSDRRKKIIAPTETGLELAEEIYEKTYSFHALLLERFGEEMVIDFIKLRREAMQIGRQINTQWREERT